MVGDFSWAVLGFIVVVVLRLSATFINLIFNAFMGFPFIYDTKIQMIESREKENKNDEMRGG